jgi:hypothetical protein
MPAFNSAKAAELQVITWFLEAGWEVFTPVVDANQTDAVVRIPRSTEVLAIQIKHKEPGGRNEGWLKNKWRSCTIPFDYMVIYQPAKVRGAILAREELPRIGSTIQLYKHDRNGYSNGPFRPKYREVSFDLADLEPEDRATGFAARLLETHRQPKPLVR